MTPRGGAPAHGARTHRRGGGSTRGTRPPQGGTTPRGARRGAPHRGGHPHTGTGGLPPPANNNNINIPKPHHNNLPHTWHVRTRYVWGGVAVWLNNEQSYGFVFVSINQSIKGPHKATHGQGEAASQHNHREPQLFLYNKQEILTRKNTNKYRRHYRHIDQQKHH